MSGKYFVILLVDKIFKPLSNGPDRIPHLMNKALTITPNPQDRLKLMDIKGMVTTDVGNS
jgi:hypothetical protein